MFFKCVGRLSSATMYAAVTTALGLAACGSEGPTTVDTSPSALSFSVQPTTISAYWVMAAIEVTVVDAQGAATSSPPTDVTMAIGTRGATGAVLYGTLMKTTIDGVATFDDLTIEQAGIGFSLAASAPGLASAESAPFEVDPWAGIPNQIILDSDSGDYVGLGRSYEYTNQNARIFVSSNGGLLSVVVEGDEKWHARFQSPDSLARLTPGLFGELMRYPFHNPIRGGLSWGGEGRGCNKLSGWFAVDTVRYRAEEVSAVHLRFAQHCESSAPALRGTIHWDAADTLPPVG